MEDDCLQMLFTVAAIVLVSPILFFLPFLILGCCPGPEKKEGEEVFEAKGDALLEAGLLEEAAQSFCLAKNWKKAASAYNKLAICQSELEPDYRAKAALSYHDAGKCYKKISVHDDAEAQECFTLLTVQALRRAIRLYLEENLEMEAGKLCWELAEFYEQRNYLEQAADHFKRKQVLADECKQKVAQLAAQMKKYTIAAKIFEEVALRRARIPDLKCTVNGILFNAGLCRLCEGHVFMKNILKIYKGIDATFQRTHGYKLLSVLAESVSNKKVTKEFMDQHISKYSRRTTHLDLWKKTLLERVKGQMMTENE